MRSGAATVDDLAELIPGALVLLTTEPSEGAEHVELVRRTMITSVWDKVGDRNATVGDHGRLAGLGPPRERAAGSAPLSPPSPADSLHGPHEDSNEHSNGAGIRTLTQAVATEADGASSRVSCQRTGLDIP